MPIVSATLSLSWSRAGFPLRDPDHAGGRHRSSGHRGVDGADVPGGGTRESVWIGPARRHATKVRALGRGFFLADRAMVSGSTSASFARAACLDRLQPGQPEAPERGYRARPETAIPAFVQPLAFADSLAHTEPYGSVCERPTRCLLRRALGRHPTRRPGAARTCRRFDHGSGPDVPHDPHGHEEARRRPGAGRARHHGEGRARADLPARPAPTRRGDGMDRAVPPALGLHASTSWTRSSRN